MGNCFSAKHKKILPADDLPVLVSENEDEDYDYYQEEAVGKMSKLEKDLYGSVLKKEKSAIGYYNRPADY
jgi:hypothetical protein